MYDKILYSLIFIAAAILLSFRFRAGMEKEISISTFRAFIQLLIIGYFLEYIFGLENPVYIFLLILIMTLVGGFTSNRRAEGLPKALFIAWGFIAISAVFTLGVLLTTDIIAIEPAFLIPMAGIIIGNSVKAASLSFIQVKREVTQNRQRIETALSMGATGRQSVLPVARSIIRTASVPIIETFKIVGFIQMPGIMTGMLLAGSPPLEAVTYQIVVLYTLLISVIITSYGVTFASLNQYFTSSHQLKEYLIN